MLKRGQALETTSTLTEVANIMCLLLFFPRTATGKAIQNHFSVTVFKLQHLAQKTMEPWWMTMSLNSCSLLPFLLCVRLLYLLQNLTSDDSNWHTILLIY